jgi:hypothetical protein
MGDAVRKLEPVREVAHDFANVLAVRGAEVDVESAWGRRTLRRAPSCLVEPGVGDRVLVAESEVEGYVLAVVASEGDTSKVTVPGDLHVNVPNGKFTVSAAEGVDLITSRAVQMVASALKMRAAEGEVLVDKLAYVGKELVGDTRTAKLVVGAMTSFVDRLQQNVKRSFRTVEETDQLRAKRVDYRTDEELTLRARHAFVTASALIKMMGEQIHMG